MVSVIAPLIAVRFSPQAFVFSLGRLLVFHVKVSDTFSLFCISFVVLLSCFFASRLSLFFPAFLLLVRCSSFPLLLLACRSSFLFFCFSLVLLLICIINNNLSFINHMSCNKETYVSRGGSNCCADQLMNRDRTQKQEF